jgi:hypothetical protein
VQQNYQTIDAAATALAVPEAVTVALGEIVADVREGLLAMAVGTGLQVMAAMMDADVVAACGPKGKHDPNRSAVRHGTEKGSVTLGGRRVPVERPRMRANDGSGELPVRSYELFTGTEVLGRLAMQKMLAGISTAVGGLGWSQSASRSNGRRRRQASPRSAGGSSRRPKPH